VGKKGGTQAATTPEQLIEAAHAYGQRINGLFEDDGTPK
jgi:hypothetical protein